MGEQKISLNRMATAVDVAERAGVSQSTVSRVFNKNWKGSLSEKTRRRVLNAAEELGYTPNALAHILTSKRSHMVGVVVSKEHDLFYSDVLTILVNLLNDAGLRTIVFTCVPSQSINELLRDILQYQVDGVIITSAALSHNLTQEWVDADTPVVIYNGYLPGMKVNAVHSDNYGACIKTAEFLVGLGHKKFAYFTTGQSVYQNYMPRQDAFLFGLSQQGIYDCQIYSSGYRYDRSLNAAREYFAAGDVADAIFCSGDLNAIATIDAAREYGYEPGKDLSIVGFYAPTSVEFGAYQLTCLKQDVLQLAKDAVMILKSKMEHPDSPMRIITRPMQLCVGKTTLPCPEELADRLCAVPLVDQNKESSS